ncbi:MAG: hypothetical protein Q7K43_00030, partial [Candidatus Woesearchaeota archaeon]|nr:hypothetical protein [Candidatus Woesearchaeota archaeon]
DAQQKKQNLERYVSAHLNAAKNALIRLRTYTTRKMKELRKTKSALDIPPHQDALHQFIKSKKGDANNSPKNSQSYWQSLYCVAETQIPLLEKAIKNAKQLYTK